MSDRENHREVEMCNQKEICARQTTMADVDRKLRRRLREIDARVIRQLAEEWTASKSPILLKRHFLVGLCGHWSQHLDALLAIELGAILKTA